jgi:LysM repeat protein
LLLITKFFQLLGKIIFFIFIYLIKKPIIFIFNFLLYKRIVKFYHWYRKKYCLKDRKNEKEIKIKKENNEKIFGHRDLKFGKNYNRIFVIVTIITLISYQYIYIHSAKANSEKHTQAIVTNLISNKFNNLTDEEELIEETLDQGSLMLNINFSEINKYNQTLKPEKKISEKEKIDNKEILVDIPLNKKITLKNNYSDSSSENNNTTTVNSNKRIETIEYVVKSGDNVSSIAEKFGISVNTILWENNLSSRSLLGIGDKLRILPLSGISHKISRGENLSYIASIYNVKISDILKTNNLFESIGSTLLVKAAHNFNELDLDLLNTQ